ncbi:DUF2892 domain-containing protein [Natronomonas sp. F2-12]|jgi:hypothetical protein|uniref:DUF2892 domain-containing protein n=1 Tax=Natronomonas aquatica TaxID=2841590 RepID=A0A9R1CRF2_9EURY|nr:DUF2892 domain-containing protein [Natronomonas aquatica]MCQ4332448.1 DUF2892 domain-containing protein [Natronomonas aquatica]
MTKECDRFVRRFAGAVILAGFLLGWFVNEWFFLIDAFAGANLIQSTFTGICPPQIACEKWTDRAAGAS